MNNFDRNWLILWVGLSLGFLVSAGLALWGAVSVIRAVFGLN